MTSRAGAFSVKLLQLECQLMEKSLWQVRSVNYGLVLTVNHLRSMHVHLHSPTIGVCARQSRDRIRMVSSSVLGAG